MIKRMQPSRLSFFFLLFCELVAVKHALSVPDRPKRNNAPNFPNRTVLDEKDFGFELTPFGANSPRLQTTWDGEMVRQKPIISVITTLYNAADEGLMPSFESVFGQTFKSWEWIVVDDGSRNVPSLLQSLCLKTDVLCVNSKHVGLAGARMRGVAASRGKYLLFLDGDDYLEPTFLEKTFWLLDTQRHVAACGGWTVAFGGRQYMWKKGFQGNAHPGDNALTVTNLIRRDVFYKVGGFNTSFVHGLEDWDLWMRIAEYGMWGITIPEFMFWYSRAAPSTSSATKWTAWGDQSYIDYFHARYPRYWSDFPPRISIDDRSDRHYSPPRLVPRNAIGGKRFATVVATLNDAEKVSENALFQHDLVAMLASNGWHVTLIFTTDSNALQAWLPRLLRFTSDYFVLPRFLVPQNFEHFITSTLQARRPDAVYVFQGAAGEDSLSLFEKSRPSTPVFRVKQAQGIDSLSLMRNEKTAIRYRVIF